MDLFKGVYNGICNAPECNTELGYIKGGNSYHNVTGLYYCSRCAARLNIHFNATERTALQQWNGYMLLIDIDREGKRPEIE